MSLSCSIRHLWLLALVYLQIYMLLPSCHVSSFALKPQITNSFIGTPGSANTLSMTTFGGGKKEMLCLDFDGVLCASAGESSFSSIIAARDMWPEDCTIDYSFEFNKVRQYVSELRPIIETGYENMLLVRYLLEDIRVNGVCDVDTGCEVDIEPIYSKWGPKLINELIERYDTDKPTLIKAFGDMRDKIINERYQFWVNLNEIYPEVVETLKEENMQLSPEKLGAGGEKLKLDYTIITSKQGRFVNTILENNEIMPPPPDQLYDLENPMGSKPNVLTCLLQGVGMHSSPEEIAAALAPNALSRFSTDDLPCIHFVEDRYICLKQVLATPYLKENTKLYLVDYGYNTAEERAEAAANPDITVIDGKAFSKLLRKFCVRVRNFSEASSTTRSSPVNAK